MKPEGAESRPDLPKAAHKVSQGEISIERCFKRRSRRDRGTAWLQIGRSQRRTARFTTPYRGGEAPQIAQPGGSCSRFGITRRRAPICVIARTDTKPPSRFSS